MLHFGYVFMMKQCDYTVKIKCHFSILVVGNKGRCNPGRSLAMIEEAYPRWERLTLFKV
jgi:hypothetical protein